VVYFSPNINQVIKSRMMRGWACSTYGKERKYILSFGEEIRKGRGYLEDIGVDGRMILTLLFNN